MLNPYKKLLKHPKLNYPNIKPTCSIIKIYESLCMQGKTKRSGRALLIQCPFHGEDNPSCALYDDTNSYFCFSCGAAGDYITFVMKLQEMDFRTALETIKNL